MNTINREKIGEVIPIKDKEFLSYRIVEDSTFKEENYYLIEVSYSNFILKIRTKEEYKNGDYSLILLNL